MSPEVPRLYERVGARLRESITAGVLRPGDRLPSVRALSQIEAVSVSTVLEALTRLEASGLIEARPQSGHYVRRPRTIPDEPLPSRSETSGATVSVQRLVTRVYGNAGDASMVPLGTATPAPELLPVRRLNGILMSLARRHGSAAIAYDMPPGCLALRQQLARRGLMSGCVLSPDDFITTCGASEAILLSLMAVARRGDVIGIEAPAYYGTLQAIEALGLRALELASHPRHGLELPALDEALRRRRLAAVLLVPSFSNPMGSCMPDAHRKELVQLLARHDVPLIEDDIYGDLHFGPQRAKAARAYDKRGLVLLCGSVSKTLAPGYRVGWVAPGRYRERVELLKFAHSVATPSLPQLAVAEMLASGGYDRHLRALRRHFADQVRQTTNAVVDHFPAGTRVSRPQGGFVLWVEMPPAVDALELEARAREARISIAPGPIFSARRKFAHCLRLSCGHPWSDRLEAGIRTLGELAHQSARG